MNIYRDIAVMAGIFLLFLVVWFGAPAIWEKTQGIIPLPEQVPTILPQTEQTSLKNKAQALKKELWSGSKKSSHTYIELGGVYEKLGYLQKAAQTYGAALREEPQNGEILYSLSRVYEKGERVTEAQEYYLQAFDKNPSQVQFYQSYADFLATKLHDFESARGVYLKGLIATSNNAELMGYFVDFLQNSGYDSEAELYRTYLNGTKGKLAPKEVKNAYKK